MPDQFELYYSNNNSFDGERRLSKAITGSLKKEVLSFNIPDDNYFIRLDISKNSAQTNVTIHKIIIESSNKTKTYKGMRLTSAFRQNQQIKDAKIIEDGVSYTFKNIYEKYDPILGPVHLQQLFL